MRYAAMKRRDRTLAQPWDLDASQEGADHKPERGRKGWKDAAPIAGKATIHDVAAAADVSVATVSRVLNGAASVAPATGERVRAAVARLNFVPSAVARNLSRNRTDTLGLLFPEISGPFISEIIRGIEAITREQGY